MSKQNLVAWNIPITKIYFSEVSIILVNIVVRLFLRSTNITVYIHKVHLQKYVIKFHEYSNDSNKILSDVYNMLFEQRAIG